MSTSSSLSHQLTLLNETEKSLQALADELEGAANAYIQAMSRIEEHEMIDEWLEDIKYEIAEPRVNKILLALERLRDIDIKKVQLYKSKIQEAI